MNPSLRSSFLRPGSSMRELLEVIETAVVDLGWSERSFVSGEREGFYAFTNFGFMGRRAGKSSGWVRQADGHA